MDPIAAIGLASGIVAFIGFGTKAVKATFEVHSATDVSGALEENRNREVVAREMKLLAARLIPAENITGLAAQELGLCNLATECRGISQDLIKLLEQIKPNDKKSKSQSLRSALRNWRYQKDRQELEKRLANCRDQLDLHVDFSILTSVRALTAAVEKDSDNFQRIKNTIDEIMKYITREVHGPLSRLLNMQEEALRRSVSTRILNALSFEGMSARYNMVPEAHVRTFRWMVDDTNRGSSSLEMENHPTFLAVGDSRGAGGQPLSDTDSVDPGPPELPDEVEEIRRDARAKYLGWLSSGQGIFHICGKIGSGKSTLMKFLSEHSTTRAHLESWADQKVLVLASFFFWKPGSKLQTSLDDLIPSVFTDDWNCAMDTSVVKIQPRSIRAAFGAVVSGKHTPDHAFCFFIDGLDEYQSLPECDYHDVVDHLCRWTALATSSVKVCVSSREHNVFMTGFSPSQRLRLHELTQYDLTAYVENRLARWRKLDGMALLVESIVTKAGGIFLWVSLVVREIRQGLEDGVNPDELLDTLDELPGELESLYRHILQSLGEKNRRMAYQTMAMVSAVMCGRCRGAELSLLQYHYFDAYCKDAEFAQRPDFEALLSSNEIASRMISGYKRLRGTCRGLVDADKEGRVGYSHRSVTEFLQTPAIKSQMELYSPGVQHVEALSQLMLASMRVTGDFERLAFPAVRMRDKYNLDQAPYTFLQSLEMCQGEEKWDSVPKRYNHQIMPIVENNWLSTYTKIPTPTRRGEWATPEVVPLTLPTDMFPLLESPAYTLWKICSDPKVTATAPRVIFLANLALWNWHCKSTHAVLDLLLDRVVITPLPECHYLPVTSTRKRWTYTPTMASSVSGNCFFWSLCSRGSLTVGHRKNIIISAASRLVFYGTFTFGDHNSLLEVSSRHSHFNTAASTSPTSGVSALKIWREDHKGEPGLEDWVRDLMDDFQGKGDLLRLVTERLAEM
ncbi:hypothetical protein OQA88_12560 [Cercophora sp. LCS_1]